MSEEISKSGSQASEYSLSKILYESVESILGHL